MKVVKFMESKTPALEGLVEHRRAEVIFTKRCQMASGFLMAGKTERTYYNSGFFPSFYKIRREDYSCLIGWVGRRFGPVDWLQLMFHT